MNVDVAGIADAAAALQPEARGCLGRLWGSRFVHELETANAFERIRPAAQRLDVPQNLVHLLARAAADERRHARLCAEVAGAYLPGVSLVPAVLDVKAAEAPLASRSSLRETSLLSIMRQCCFSETIAVAYLVRCREQCDVTALRAVLKRLLKDEMTHARVGWGVLASVRLSEAESRTVAGTLPELFEEQYTGWRGGYREESRALVLGHGFVDFVTLTHLVCDTLEHVVLPGLRNVGIDVGEAERWAATRLATCDKVRPRMNGDASHVSTLI